MAEVGIEKCDHFIPIGKTVGFIDFSKREERESIEQQFCDPDGKLPHKD